MANWWDKYSEPVASGPAASGNWWDKYAVADDAPDFGDVNSGVSSSAPDPNASFLDSAWRANKAQMGPIFAGNVKRMAAEVSDPIAGLLNGTFGKPAAEDAPELSLTVNPNGNTSLPASPLIAPDAGMALMDAARGEPLRNATLRDLQQSGLAQARAGGAELQQARTDMEVPESGLERYAKLAAISAGPTLAGMTAGIVTKSPAVGAGVSTLFAVPSAYGEARDAGHSVEEAIKYAGVVGGAEVVSERLGFDALLGKLATRLPAGKLATVFGTLEKSIPGRALTGAGVEGTTEALSQAAQNAYKIAGLGEHMTFDEFMTDMKDSFGAGAMIGGPLAGGHAAAQSLAAQSDSGSEEERIRRSADQIIARAERIQTPESEAVDAGRNAAAAIFGDAGISNDTGQPIPDPRTIDFTQAVDPETGLPSIGVQPEVMGDLDAMVPSEPEAAPDPVRPAVEPVAQPAQETQGKSIPGLSEPIRSGTRVFYPGDVDAMRAKLDAAGLDAGMRRNNEDGTPAGLYFPARMQAEVDAVLRPKVPAPVAAQETAVPEPPAYQGQKIPPPRKQRNQVRSAKDFDPNYHDIRDFIALNGGLDFGAFKSEFKSEIPDDNVRFFGKPLFRKNGGMKPDQLRERLQEAGFLNEDSPDAPPQYTQQDAYDLVDRALDGNPVYHPAGVDVQNQLRANNEYDAEQERRQAYIDEHGVTPELDSEFADRAAALDRGDLERMYSKRAKDRTATPDMFGATQRAQTSPAPRPASGDLFGSPTSSERLDAAQRDSDARLTGPAIGMRQGEGELFAGQRPRQETIPSRSNSTPSDPTSWILRDKETGKAVMETTDRRKVDALNTNKYEAVSAERHMQEVNTKGTLAYAAARGSEIKRSQRPDTQGIEVDEATPTPEEMAAFNRQVDNRQRQPENRANDAQRLPADTGLVRRPADGTTAPERAGMVSARGNRDSQSSARQVSPAADAKPDLTGQPPKFGQWFRQSKMKDAKARPMEFHHATDADFDTFDAGKRGSSTGFAPTGLGNWFSQDAGAIKGYGSKVLSGHLRLENPKVMDSHELPDLESKADYEALAKKYKVEGYDGLYFPDSKQAVAFDSVQFKENRNSGEYSESPNIYRSQHADNQSETPQAKDAKDSKDAGKLKETSNTASEPKRLFIPEVKAAKESPEQVTTKKARPEELIEARKRRGNLRQLLDCLNA